MNETKNKTVSFAQEADRWIPKHQVPHFRHDFDTAKDPTREYKPEIIKSQSDAQTDKGKTNIHDHIMQPPPQIRDPVLQDHWLAAARAAVMAQASDKQSSNDRTDDKETTQSLGQDQDHAHAHIHQHTR